MFTIPGPFNNSFFFNSSSLCKYACLMTDQSLQKQLVNMCYYMFSRHKNFYIMQISLRTLYNYQINFDLTVRVSYVDIGRILFFLYVCTKCFKVKNGMCHINKINLSKSIYSFQLFWAHFKHLPNNNNNLQKITK